MTARPIPYSLEAEESLLSICIQDGLPTLNKCMEARLTPGSFYDSKHGTVFARLLGMLADNKPIAIDTLAEDMKEARVLDHVGGYAFLAQVSGRMPTSAQAAYFIEKVADYARLRAVIRNGTELVEAAHNWTGDWDAVKTKAEGAMEAFTVSEASMTMEEAAQDALRAAADMAAGKQDKDTLRWPIEAMDRNFCPIGRHELVFIGARPMTGKTSIQLQLLGQCIADKKKTAHFALETSTRQTMLQIAGQRAEVNLRGLNVTPQDKLKRFNDTLSYLGKGEYLRVYDRDLTMDAIAARCRALKQGWGLDCVSIDYLTIIGGGRGKTLYESVTDIANRLVAFRKAVDCPVIVTCQLNRGSEREEREPRLSDLRDTGAIEQAGHRIVFIWRPVNDFSGAPQVGAEVGQRASYDCYLLQAKLRDGPVSSIKTKFAATHAKFLPA